MTNQEYVAQIIESTSDLLVDNGQNLYVALRDQNYEKAVMLRDQAKEIIQLAADLFVKNTSGGTREYFEQHFEQQQKFIYDSLIEEYGEFI